MKTIMEEKMTKWKEKSIFLFQSSKIKINEKIERKIFFLFKQGKSGMKKYIIIITIIFFLLFELSDGEKIRR